jgi:hypothetical protein
MAVQFDPWAPQTFDLSREYILSNPTPSIQVANVLTNSTTKSTYRLHWNWLALWEDFGNLVHQYWNNVVPQADKRRNVFSRGAYSNAVQLVATFMRVANEGDIKGRIQDFVIPVHSAAANGLNGAPRPIDQHSVLQRWEQGVEANNLAGIPDFIMATEYGNPQRRVTVLLEVKNPWQVTPTFIDAVINGRTHLLSNIDIVDEVPLTGLHPARLAVEQLYGYMVRNGKAYGVLTTMKGWCFFRRVNGGGLYITRMFGDFVARPGLSQGAFAEGYYTTPNFTIMQALYYLSSLSETTNDLPEIPLNGVPGQVNLPYAGDSTTAARTIQQPQPSIAPMPAGQGGYGYGYIGQGSYQSGFQGVQVLGGYDQAECCQYHDDVDYTYLQFQPWKAENILGPKNWIAKVLSDESEVVLKLWDAWKLDAEAQNREASIYLHLRSLWGKYIPCLRVKTSLDYFHALIFQYVKVSYPSTQLLIRRHLQCLHRI